MTDGIKWSGPFTGLDGVIRAAQAEKEGLIVEVTYGRDPRTRRDPVSGFHKEFDYYIGEEVKPREFLVAIAAGRPPQVFTSRAGCDTWLASFQIRPEVMLVREVIK